MDLGRVELDLREPEVEAEMQLVGPQVLGPAGVVGNPHFADGHRPRILVDHPADVAVDLMHTRVVEARVVVGVMQHLGPDLRRVRQSGRFGHPMRDVDAEAVHAALQPEPQRLLEIIEDLGVVPVQVRLFGVE